MIACLTCPLRFHISRDNSSSQTTTDKDTKRKVRQKSKCGDIFTCQRCSFSPKTKTQEAMYKHYVFCLPDFLRNLASFFPTFLLLPASSSYACPLCSERFSQRFCLEVHLGTHHCKVEPYLSRAKVITDKKIQKWKDNEATKDKDDVKEDAIKADSRNVEVTDDNIAIKFKATYLNPQGSQVSVIQKNPKMENHKADGIGVVPTLDKFSKAETKDDDDITVATKEALCSQIILEEAVEDSSDCASDDEDYNATSEPVEKMIDEVEEKTESDSQERNMQVEASDDDTDSDFDDAPIIDIEANITEVPSVENQSVMDTTDPKPNPQPEALPSRPPPSPTKYKGRPLRPRKRRYQSVSSGGPEVYCLCRRPYSRAHGPMVACDGPCQDWYHFSCLGLGPGHSLAPGPWYCTHCSEALRL